jgi:hypothetical protein
MAQPIRERGKFMASQSERGKFMAQPIALYGMMDSEKIIFSHQNTM